MGSLCNTAVNSGKPSPVFIWWLLSSGFTFSYVTDFEIGWQHFGGSLTPLARAVRTVTDSRFASRLGSNKKSSQTVIIDVCSRWLTRPMIRAWRTDSGHLDYKRWPIFRNLTNFRHKCLLWIFCNKIEIDESVFSKIWEIIFPIESKLLVDSAFSRKLHNCDSSATFTGVQT